PACPDQKQQPLEHLQDLGGIDGPEKLQRISSPHSVVREEQMTNVVSRWGLHRAGGEGLLNPARFPWGNPEDGTLFMERVPFIQKVLFGALRLMPGDLICAQREWAPGVLRRQALLHGDLLSGPGAEGTSHFFCRGHGYRMEDCLDMGCLNCFVRGYMAQDCKGSRRCRRCQGEGHLACSCPTQGRTYAAAVTQGGSGGATVPEVVPGSPGPEVGPGNLGRKATTLGEGERTEMTPLQSRLPTSRGVDLQSPGSPKWQRRWPWRQFKNGSNWQYQQNCDKTTSSINKAKDEPLLPLALGVVGVRGVLLPLALGVVEVGGVLLPLALGVVEVGGVLLPLDLGVVGVGGVLLPLALGVVEVGGVLLPLALGVVEVGGVLLPLDLGVVGVGGVLLPLALGVVEVGGVLLPLDLGDGEESMKVIGEEQAHYAETQGPNCSLTLSNLTQEDGSIYHFSFRTNGSTQEMTNEDGVTLEITDVAVEVVSLLDVVLEGSWVTLTCGTCIPSLTHSTYVWRKDGRPCEQRHGDNQLELPQADPADSGSCTCSILDHEHLSSSCPSQLSSHRLLEKDEITPTTDMQAQCVEFLSFPCLVVHGKVCLTFLAKAALLHAHVVFKQVLRKKALAKRQQNTSNETAGRSMTSKPIEKATIGSEPPPLDETTGLDTPTVALTEGEQSKSITILRDTGAAQSFVLGSILLFSESSYCGSDVLVQGIKLGACKFGEVNLSEIFLGNESVLSLESRHPEHQNEQPLLQDDKCDWTDPINRTALIAAQKDDASLVACFEASTDNSGTVTCYFILNGVSMRKSYKC
ncbi:hypothetical protein P4O66_021654, partial [Electrophorus voltai]